MARLARLTLPILLALMASSVAARTEPRTGADHIAPAANCFWVHGRLFAANGAPTFRIWRIGTKRILGVVDAAGGSDSVAVLPDSVRTLVAPDAFQVLVYGAFQVCPLAEDRPGRMRPVRVINAARLIARPTPNSADGSPRCPILSDKRRNRHPRLDVAYRLGGAHA